MTLRSLRLSFRQTLLAGCLSIAFLLCGVAVRGWLLLEQNVAQGRLAGASALRVDASIRELRERTVDLERSARQYLIVGKPALLERFDDNAARALAALAPLETLPAAALGGLAGDWRRTLAQLSGTLHDGAAAGEAARLPARLGDLARLNGELEQRGRRWNEEQQAQIVAQLDADRFQLARQLALAIVAALLVALAMNRWLSRPLADLERAIARLGEGRYAQDGAAVAAGGPADLRRLGGRIEWLRRRLGELEADHERSLRHVSHELKTPLTALREGIALLQDEVPGPLRGAQREVVDILQNKVVTLQRQIEGLLRLNAVAYDVRRPDCRPLALRQLLAEVVAARQLQITARGLVVRCEAPALDWPLDGDKMRVALDNLLSNAIDFSPAGGVISLRAEAAGKTLRIVCADQGPGVAAEDARRIFEPFVQGGRAPPEPRQGSGVGLSIVRELLAAMGGSIVLDRTLAGNGDLGSGTPGACFRIEVPCE